MRATAWNGNRTSSPAALREPRTFPSPPQTAPYSMPRINCKPQWEGEMEKKSGTIARPWQGHSIAGGTPMDTYVVRIYRRKGGNPNRISGHVIKVEVKERQEFFDSEMLRYILDPTFPDTQQRGSPPSPRNGNDGWMNMVDVIRAIAEEEKL